MDKKATKKEDPSRFAVTKRAVFEQTVYIDADSHEEAIDLVKAGGGTPAEGDPPDQWEFSREMRTDAWDIYMIWPYIEYP
jgi:hypothetical protein